MINSIFSPELLPIQLLYIYVYFLNFLIIMALFITEDHRLTGLATQEKLIRTPKRKKRTQRYGFECAQ